jgi:hypothetical protein
MIKSIEDGSIGWLYSQDFVRGRRFLEKNLELQDDRKVFDSTVEKIAGSTMGCTLEENP